MVTDNQALTWMMRYGLLKQKWAEEVIELRNTAKGAMGFRKNWAVVQAKILQQALDEAVLEAETLHYQEVDKDYVV